MSAIKPLNNLLEFVTSLITSITLKLFYERDYDNHVTTTPPYQSSHTHSDRKFEENPQNKVKKYCLPSKLSSRLIFLARFKAYF